MSEEMKVEDKKKRIVTLISEHVKLRGRITEIQKERARLEAKERGEKLQKHVGKFYVNPHLPSVNICHVIGVSEDGSRNIIVQLHQYGRNKYAGYANVTGLAHLFKARIVQSLTVFL